MPEPREQLGRATAATATRRFAADVVDGLLLAILFMAATYLVALGYEAFTTGTVSASQLPPPPSRAVVVLNIVVNVALSLAYWGLVEGRGGQSVGKRLVEIRVRRPDGGPISPRDAVARKLPFYLPFLGAAVPVIGGWFVVLAGAVMVGGLISYVADDDQRGFHDRWAATRVVEA